MVSRNCLKISRDNIFVDKLQNDYWIVREKERKRGEKLEVEREEKSLTKSGRI